MSFLQSPGNKGKNMRPNRPYIGFPEKLFLVTNYDCYYTNFLIIIYFSLLLLYYDYDICTGFDNVNQTELSPFIAVLRMIKIEYALTKPEIFKTLVAVLHDFNPSAGSQLREKVFIN